MRIGVPTELKTDEFRVALTPTAVESLTSGGHQVMVENRAGWGSYFSNQDYEAAGATILDQAAEVWAESDLIVKVKEPQDSELSLLKSGQILFTYLHLAAYPQVAEALCRSGAIGLAYETTRLPNGALPLLAPMSEVAGRMAAQVGARFLEKSGGGRGVLMGGVPGVPPARVAIIGGGLAGSNALRVATGMGADVTVFDLNPARLRELDSIYGGAITTAMAHRADVRAAVLEADLVIGAVLLPGARAPRVLTAADVSDMKAGAVVVDIAIDQGGCFETSRETTHSNPTYILDEVVHYAVGNIPGAVPRTSTFALVNATLPYIRLLADQGLDQAMVLRPELAEGLNVRDGRVTNDAVRSALE